MNFSEQPLSSAQSNTPVALMLGSKEEINNGKKFLETMGLPGHHDSQKNWDLALTLSLLLNYTKVDEFVLDAGSGSKAVFARSAKSLGYSRVYACDLQEIVVPNIEKSRQNIEATNYPSSFFSFIACHSVIEHGVSIETFFSEMYRILKPGGIFAVSTDFWPEYEDYSHLFPYGVDNSPMKLYDNNTLNDLFSIASTLGFKVPNRTNFEPPEERPIIWERMKAEYTFVWFCFAK